MIEIDVLTPNDAPRRVITSRATRLLQGLGLTLAVAAAAWLAAPATSRAGPETDYVLSNVTAVFDGTPVSISGSFIEGGGEWRAYIVVTGNSPDLGVYTWGYTGAQPNDILSPNPFSNGNGLVVYKNGQIGGPTLQMNFANLIPGVSSAVSNVIINGVTGTNTTGGAVVTGGSIDYEFSNASTVLNGKSESITGYFTYDPLTNIEFIAQMQLTGTARYDRKCFFDAEQLGINGNSMNADCGDTIMQVAFANKLSYSDDPLAEVIWDPFTIDTAPTGVVCAEGRACPTAAPEPTSLALLGAGLGLFLTRHRGTRRVGQPRADQPERA